MNFPRFVMMSSRRGLEFRAGGDGRKLAGSEAMRTHLASMFTALALAAGLAGSGAAAARPFTLAFTLGQLPPGGPESWVALAGLGPDLFFGSAAEDGPGSAAVIDGRTGSTLLLLQSPTATIAVQDFFGSFVATARWLLVDDGAGWPEHASRAEGLRQPRRRDLAGSRDERGGHSRPALQHH
jgi:hypothetical protein